MIFNFIVDLIASGSNKELNGSLFGLYALLSLIAFFLTLASVSLGLKISDAFDEKGILNPSNKKRSRNFLFAIFLVVVSFSMFVSFYGSDWGKENKVSYKEISLVPNDKEIPIEILSIRADRVNYKGDKILEAWVFLGEKGHGEVKVFKIDEKNSSINYVDNNKSYVVKKAKLIIKKSTYSLHGHEFSYSGSEDKEFLQIDVDVPKTPTEILTSEKD